MSDSTISKDKEFRDPIHGFIRISKEELSIINNPIFQRLRNIKQLSFAYLVYHGAEHTRFGHSIGTMHLVEKALRKIMSNSKIFNKYDITEDDIKLARFATLIHDTGHFPFSHTFDGILDDHAKYSAELSITEFAAEIEKAKIDPNDVKNLILEKPPVNKPYLSQLLSGQLDVDKFDYLLRDSYFAGVKYGVFDIDRLIDSLCIIDNQLLVLDNGYFTAEQLIIARYHMFEQVYYHHTKRAFEEMIRKVSRYLINNENENKKLCYPQPTDLRDPEIRKDFVKYTDYWFLEKMKNSDDPRIQKISKLIENRIPFKIILDSGNVWKQIEENDPAAGRGVILAIQEDIKYNLKNIDIDEDEIIFDHFRNIPYKLRPYYNIGKDNSDESNVYIYNKKIDNKKPIEDLSIIVKQLATNVFSTMRIYIERNKKNNLMAFLNNKYSKFLDVSNNK